MAQPGDELFVAVRTDAVVPVLVVGRGGTDVERHDDVDDHPAARDRDARQAVDHAHRRRGIVKAADGLALLECNPVYRRRRRRRCHRPGGRHVNAIAQQLGEVGLPAPVAELASRRWDVVVVGGGHNGLTAAAYLAKAGKSVLVLERRERLGGACTLERPFADPEYVSARAPTSSACSTSWSSTSSASSSAACTSTSPTPTSGSRSTTARASASGSTTTAPTPT